MKSKLISRLLAENIKDLSDAELQRTLEGCCHPGLIGIAKGMRDAGELTTDFIAKNRR